MEQFQKMQAYFMEHEDAFRRILALNDTDAQVAEVLRLAGQEGIDLSEDKVRQALVQMDDQELSDQELEAVTGGKVPERPDDTMSPC